MTRRLLAAACLLASLSGACAGESPPAGGLAGQLVIRAHAVGVPALRLGALRVLSSVSLKADHAQFGGFSGLVIRAGRLIAVTDRGWLLEGDLDAEADVPMPRQARFGALSGTDGLLRGKAGGDAEALTLRDGILLLAFEHDHRLMMRTGDLSLGGTVRDRGFESLSTNRGLEALATLPDGRLLAVEERARRGVHRQFLVGQGGAVGMRALPQVEGFSVTGADIGPDGRLYLLRRDYSRLSGVSIRVHRYALGADGWPMPDTREELAAFEGTSGIDNMEGLTVWRDAAGRTRLTMISDDNFNLIQRTLLLDFEVFDAP